MPSSSPSFTLKTVTLADLPEIAKFGAEAFISDRNTEVKALDADEPYDVYKNTIENTPFYLRNPRCVANKAVDDVTGEILGWSCWGFRGWEESTIPRLSDEGGAWRANKEAEIKRKEQEAAEEAAAGDSNAEDASSDKPLSLGKQLDKLTSDDMGRWEDHIMPPGTKCMYVCGLSVAPAHQRRGVGSALLAWGAKVADEAQTFMWVHSSESAWQMYQKSGFEIVQTLDVDLDKYAVAPRPVKEGDEPHDGKWGHYVFRYMVRQPRAVEAK
ncbi:hypothetical protein HKX48_002222 [Thoreauomyces humboldtii]|nr:hypothetical protein HKX48_002222 [Thoreauomyces humboldtii]